MNINQKIALRQTLVDIGQPMSAAVVGSGLSYGVIYAMDSMGYTAQQIAGGCVLMLLAGLMLYLVYDIYRHNLKSAEREEEYRARTARYESEREQRRRGA